MIALSMTALSGIALSGTALSGTALSLDTLLILAFGVCLTWRWASHRGKWELLTLPNTPAVDTLFTAIKAPWTLGTFLRGFMCGWGPLPIRSLGAVRQLDAVASRVLIGLVRRPPDLLAGINTEVDKPGKRAIASIGEDAWTQIQYPQAILDPDTGQMLSAAEVADIEYTVFTSRPKPFRQTARLIVRRVPELNDKKLAGQDPLF
jgi:hypothetical protein